MSIYKILKNPKSVESQWLAVNFELQPVRNFLYTQIDTTELILPTVDLENYPWSTIGHAVELRLHQMLGSPYRDTTAAEVAVSRSQELNKLFQRALRFLWDTYVDETHTSRENAWVMYIAGSCERMLRSQSTENVGMTSIERVFGKLAQISEWQHFAKQMSRLRAKRIPETYLREFAWVNTLPQLLPVGDDLLDDIIRLSDAVITNDTWNQMSKSKDIVSSPFFYRTEGTQGNADFIIDGTLCEVKCTKTPKPVTREALKQLIFYVALDLQDDWEIDEIAIVLPRQHGMVIRVSLEMVLAHSTFGTRCEMQESLDETLNSYYMAQRLHRLGD